MFCNIFIEKQFNLYPIGGNSDINREAASNKGFEPNSPAYVQFLSLFPQLEALYYFEHPRPHLRTLGEIFSRRGYKV